MSLRYWWEESGMPSMRRKVGKYVHVIGIDGGERGDVKMRNVCWVNDVLGEQKNVEAGIFHLDEG